MVSSVNNSVILQDIDKSTSGRFKCEVSADAPSFQTEVVKAELIVKGETMPLEYFRVIKYKRN